MKNPAKFYPDQLVPLFLTGVVFSIGVLIFYLEIILLNKFIPNIEAISTNLRWSDILIGLTIYLKTSIDFAIFIGRLMHSHPGWKNRVLIEIGTALGNILGTMLILLLWATFKEVKILMAIMITVASLVLFRMAEDGFKHAGSVFFERLLKKFNSFFDPFLDRIIPHQEMNETTGSGFGKLFALSFSVPFILGLDDFAGYIPLFNVINVFGFGIGVFLGHMILNVALFLSPKTTIKIVKTPIISLIGAFAFIGLGLWGLHEAIKILIH
jgi:hypothetical protein